MSSWITFLWPVARGSRPLVHNSAAQRTGFEGCSEPASPSINRLALFVWAYWTIFHHRYTDRCLRCL